MEKTRKTSPFRLASLLRLERNPNLALQLFRNPNPNPNLTPKPFRYSARCYDLIICKLGRARIFPEMETIMDQMAAETRFVPKEALFCHVISSYARSRLPLPAIRTFHRVPPAVRSIRSFNSLLHSFPDHPAVAHLLSNLDPLGLRPDACTYNILIARSPSAPAAVARFAEMLSARIDPTPATFCALTAALCECNRLDEALWIKYKLMPLYGMKPDVYTYTSLIKGLCRRDRLGSALELKEEMLREDGIVIDSAVYSTVVRALFRAGRKGEVVGVLEEMERVGVSPDTVTYNAMIAGFCDGGEFDAAFEAVREMERRGLKPDVVSYNTIVHGLCKEGRWRDAVEVFEDMPRKGCRPDVVTYRVVFVALCEAGELWEARMVLDEMLFKGYVPEAGSARKFVEGLMNGERRDWDSVGKVLCGLAKGNRGMVLNEWEMVVPCMLKESAFLNVEDLLDYLTTQ